MQRVNKWILLILVAVSLIHWGCAGGNPKRVAYDFEVALVRQDRAEAEKYCTQNYIDNYLTGALSEYSMSTWGMSADEAEAEFGTWEKFKESHEVRISGNLARLDIKMDAYGSPGEVIFSGLVLMKTPSGWKLHEQDSEREN